MCMIYLCNQSHTPIFNLSLIIAIKLKSTENFPTAVIMLCYIWRDVSRSIKYDSVDKQMIKGIKTN
jgi:hypothetical protein